MQFARKGRNKAPVLSMTSMLDVIFLLLFYFAALSVQSQWENDMKVSLPQAKSAESPERLPGELVLNVHKDGSIVLNSMPLPLAEVSARVKRIAEFFPEQTVIIRADKDTSYETLVKVIDTCRSAGVWNFSLAAVGGGGESPEGSSK